MKAMKIERNEWESTFFGWEIYQLLLEPLISSDQVPLFSKEGLGEICQSEIAKNDFGFSAKEINSLRENSLSMSEEIFCQISPNPSLLKRGIALLQAKIPASDLKSVTQLQQLGFQLVETEMVFKQDFAFFCQDLPPCHCRMANESDLPALKKLMGNAFPNTRFREPYFSQHENQRFYQHWIENAVKGQFDDICLLSEQNGELQGAVSLRIVGNTAKLGLLAVAPKFQRQGIAKQLLVGAIAWAKKQQAESLEIRTQLSNLKAVQFYQSSGATISETHYWFYQKQNSQEK